MTTISMISLFSAITSVISIVIVFMILNKVFQDKYKKPWYFIGVATLFLSISQIINFLNGFFDVLIVTEEITIFTSLALEFIAMTVLSYALLLELFILKFYKGKFVKFRFIPVQEGNAKGDLDLDVTNGKSYVAIKKDKNYFHEQFSLATKTGYEGFLITERLPREIRQIFSLEKTPIAFVNHSESEDSLNFIKKDLDENSGIVEPINLNNIITFIDNFLEESTNPFILLELDLIFEYNNFSIVLEFLKYLSSKMEKYKGVLVCLVNKDNISVSQIEELRKRLKDLE